MQNGLQQTLLFYQSKTEDKSRQQLLCQLENWLLGRGTAWEALQMPRWMVCVPDKLPEKDKPEQRKPGEALLLALSQRDMLCYMQCTEEALALAHCLQRFASAFTQLLAERQTA